MTTETVGGTPSLLRPLVVRRLPAYLRVFRRALRRDREYLTSDQIAVAMGLTPVLVRRDFATLGNLGTKKRGYGVCHTAEAIRSVLGLDRQWSVAIAGAGSHGAVMAELLSREAQSFKLVAVLDSDPLRIGTSIAGIDVVSLNQLPVLARTLGIRIGICAIERGPVHSVIEAFIDAGVKAILNCSPNSMPEASVGVYLRTFEPFSDLYLLSHSLASQEP